MKNILIIILTLSSYIVSAQEFVYIYFNGKSSELCEVNGEKENNTDTRIKKYQKIVNGKNNSQVLLKFYICNELFIAQKGSEIDTCSISKLEEIKFSDIKKLKEIVLEKNPLYPYKIFPNIYIVEDHGKDKIKRYKVKWQYYIE